MPQAKKIQHIVTLSVVGIFEFLFAQNVFKCLKTVKGVGIFPSKRLKKIEKSEFWKNITLAQGGTPPPAVLRGGYFCSKGGGHVAKWSYFQKISIYHYKEHLTY